MCYEVSECQQHKPHQSKLQLTMSCDRVHIARPCHVYQLRESWEAKLRRRLTLLRPRHITQTF